jgi:hypothetical protein
MIIWDSGDVTGRRFPGIIDNAQARECTRTIAGWKPQAVKKMPKPPRLRPVR